MQDQVEALRQLGVRAAFLNSSLDAGAASDVERALLDGELDLLYVAPERLLTPRFLSLLDALADRPVRHRRGALRLAMGPRFPPRISRAHAAARTLAAGAAHRADRHRRRADAARDRRAAGAGGRAAVRQLASTAPTSATPSSTSTTAAASSPISSTARRGDSGIVYCLSRRKVDATAAALAELGINALPYHAGLDAATRAAQPAPLPARGRRSSWWRRSRSAWASTSPTCASSRTSTCRNRWKAITRKPAAPAATASRRKPGCATAWAMR